MDIIKYRPVNYVWKTRVDGNVNLYDMSDIHITNLIKFLAEKAPYMSKKFNSIIELCEPVTLERKKTVEETIEILINELKYRDISLPNLCKYNSKHFVWKLKQL